MCKDAPAIVFADMDGTFLATDKSVPAENMRALDLLAAADVPFVPCTGRPVSAVPPEVRAHPATRFAVGSNGAVVQDVKGGDVLHVEPMDRHRVLALYDLVNSLGLEATFDVFADGAVYAERWRYEAMGSYGIDEPSLAVLRRVRQPVDLDVPEIVARVRSVEKITCFWHTERDRAGLERAIGEVGGFSTAHGHPQNFELQAEGVSKGSALTWLCQHLGIPVSQAVAFGDEANDVPMLASAGDGVAMENAIAAVKAVANHATLSNDCAGVAAYLVSRFA